MSRVANNIPPVRYTNGTGQQVKPTTNRSSINSTTTNGIVNNGGGRSFNIRSAAPPSTQKETVHACPLCNSEYKDPRVLPCTHTYCFNCIRDKLIKNSRLTCPKCQYEAHPFDESHIQELPPNPILSQEWRIGARPIPSMPTPKKPVTYQSITPTQQQQQQQPDKRKPAVIENSENEISTNGTHSYGVGSMVTPLNPSLGNETNGNDDRSLSSQPVVSNLIKIYSEVSQSKPKRTNSIETKLKHDELIKIYQQVINQNQQRQISSSTNNKQQSQTHDEGYEEITWDSLVHGSTPVAPPFPDQFQTATENHHYPPEVAQRPLFSTTTDNNNLSFENLRDIVATIHRKSPEKPPSFQQTPINDRQTRSRTTSPSHSRHEDIQIRIYSPQKIRQHQTSPTESVKSGMSDLTSQANNNNNNNKLNLFNQQHDDKISLRTISNNSSTGRSSDRFPPPPQNLETFHSPNNDTIKQRLTSSMSHRSSLNDLHESTTTSEAKLNRTEQFNPTQDNISNFNRNSSSRIDSGSSTPTRRSPSRIIERDKNYSSPSRTSLLTVNVTSRVDVLLSDQKLLERDIEEQIRRLKYDFDDVRKQIDRKESTIQNEVKNIASRLNDDITEHFHRKQKIYADLAADANIVGNELERLKSSTKNNNNTSNQQLWANLEQIELNIQNIRQAVEQHKEPHNALTFAEGNRGIADDTIGQITYNGNESNHNQNEQTVTSLTPYKYLKIDHLSTLEPEAIAITENNKKILLGICNKLFILNEFGSTLKTVHLTPSIRGITISKRYQTQNIAYVSHDEVVSMIDIESGQTLDCVKETDTTGESGTFLPIGIDTDNVQGNVYVCDYRNSCVIKFDDKLEFITQWRIYNHSDQYDEARPKLLSVHAQRLYMIVEHSCKPYFNQGIAYTFSLHICDTNSGNIIKIIDADLLSTQRLRWPCSVQAINPDKCFVLDTMTSGKYFNGQWQKHWSRVLEIGQDSRNVVQELFQLDSEASTMAMTKQTMIIAANGEILFVDLNFFNQQNNVSERIYQN